MPGPLQLGWTSFNRYGISWCTTKGYRRRFSVVQTPSGYTVTDHEDQTEHQLARVATLAAAHAWAGIRVDEQQVRHGGGPSLR